MNWIDRVACVAAIVWVTFLAAGNAAAQSAGDISGTWLLASSVSEKDGKKSDQFGADAKGMLVLDPQGHFMLTIVGAGLPKFASGNRAEGTADENKAVMSRSIAMTGRYAVDAEKKTLTFHVENSTFPNWNGSEQKRLIVATDSARLQYITPTASSGGVGTVTWTRAK
jgi:hypothetical protein